jgi:hypothetical protein
MATIADILNHLIGAAGVEDRALRTRTRETIEECKLRSIPNEDVFFYIKRIDNSRVVKQRDPRARARDCRVVGGFGVATVALIAALLPSVYGVMAGYQLSRLSNQHQQLMAERARLDLEEARLTSPSRIQELAREHQFVPASQENVVYLPSSNDDSLALNRK